MEMNNPLVQLALLESLKANEIKDEIDLFLPFIAVTLSELDRLEVTPEILQKKLTESFGFIPPISAIQVFMTRAKKRGLLNKENHVFIPNMEKVDVWKNGFHEKKDDISASLQILRQEFKEFSAQKFNKQLDDSECDSLIIKFIEKNISSVTDNQRFEKAELKDKIKNTDHVTASFISHIHKNKTSSLEHFSRFVKGMLLANYLCYADKVGQKKSYESLSVYIDTPIVVGLLGFSGKQKQKSLNEFIALLKNLSVNVYIFDKTLDEAEGLLGAWKLDLQKRNYSKFNTKTLELLRQSGYDAERLETEIKLMKSSFEKLGLSVKTGFKSKERFQCDEKALKNAISPNFKNSKNLDHDTICISRIFNLREDKLIENLNQTFSVFVTPNTGLVGVANDFFKQQIPKKTIPLVVSEQWMTAMFWLKNTDVFNSLPMDQLIASAYGLLYTDDKFWASFVKKLDQLEKRGMISEADFIHVRWDSDLLNLVHDISVDVGEDFSDDDVFEIVESIKKKHLAEKEEEIAKITSDTSEKIAQLENKVCSSEKVSRSIDNHLEKLAKKISIVPAFFVSVSILGCIFWTAYSTLLSQIFQIFPNLVNINYQKHSLTAVAAFVTLLFGFAGSFWGMNILTLYKLVKEKSFMKILSILRGDV
jgi:hypothetical protein